MAQVISPVEYVRGSLKVSAKDIGAKEWLALVKEALKACCPYLKHFPSFDPNRLSFVQIKDILSRNRHTVMFTVEFPDGFDQESLVLRIEGRTEVTAEQQRRREISYHHPYASKEWSLFLTRDGKWVALEAEYENSWHFGARPPESRNQPEYCEAVVTSARFSAVSDEGLLALMEKDPCLGRKIIGVLLALAERAVQERQNRIDGFRRIKDYLEDLLSRVA